MWFQLITLASYLVPVLIYRNVQFTAFIMGFLALLVMLPTFINIIPIYAMMNINDISWGNRPPKEDEAVERRKKEIAIQQQNFMNFRFFVSATWLISNLVVATLIVRIHRLDTTIIIDIISYIIAGVSGVKLLLTFVCAVWVSIISD